jgi:long-chain acyl-CoA synthetase
MSYRNLAQLLRLQGERLGPCPAMLYRRHGLYHAVSWADYAEQADACAAALIDAGIQPGDRVGLLSENRAEWLIADMGILTAGAINVPPHAPLTAKQVHYQLDDAGVRWLFVSTREQREKVRQIQGQLADLKGIVVFDGPVLSGANVAEFTFAGFLQRGRQLRAAVRAEIDRRDPQTTADALATIMYTSGTTGNPKGVMLTHGNLLSNAKAMDDASPRQPDALLFNWLPFSHIYARTVDHYLSIFAGVTLALAESAETIVENLIETQPTHISSVPRFYEKLLSSFASLDEEKRGKRLRNIFGPRMEWLGSGGAPLPLPVAKAFQQAGLLILQGYGLTECAPVISFNRKQHFKLETVGQAIPGVDVKIAADGEVLTRGPHVMKGYWHNDAASAEAVKDGWLHTGDLGTLDSEGFLTITGRKKELLVLSNGKKVVPSHLEGLLLSEPLIDQAVVYGEGKNFLTALLVPHWDKVRQAVGKAANEMPENLARDSAVCGLLEQCVQRALAHEAPWEQVRKFVLLPRPFSVAAEELTVSLKLRRGVVFGKYKAELERLYVE